MFCKGIGAHHIRDDIRDEAPEGEMQKRGGTARAALAS